MRRPEHAASRRAGWHDSLVLPIPGESGERRVHECSPEGLGNRSCPYLCAHYLRPARATQRSDRPRSAGTLVRREEVGGCPGEAPGFLPGWVEDVWDFITSLPVEFDPSGLSLKEAFGWLAPTVAVVDYPKVAAQPLIVVDDNCRTLTTFRWRPPTSTRLWRQSADGIRKHSSPAVFANGLLAIGHENGKVEPYDVQSGTEVG